MEFFEPFRPNGVPPITSPNAMKHNHIKDRGLIMSSTIMSSTITSGTVEFGESYATMSLFSIH